MTTPLKFSVTHSKNLKILNPIFTSLPAFDEIDFKGLDSSGVMVFQAKQNDQSVNILVQSIIRNDESVLWDSCLELLKYSCEAASAQMSGIFSLELLSIELTEGFEIFRGQDLTKLIVDQSKRIVPGESRLIQYCSSFWLFTKLVDEDWGRIDLRTSIHILEYSDDKLDHIVKKLLKAKDDACDKWLILLDLSRNQVYDENNTEQKARLTALSNHFTQDLFSLHINKFIIMSHQRSVEIY